MSLRFGFFDAQLVAGVYDREYSSEDFAKCFGGFLTDGVIGKDENTSTNFEPYAESGSKSPYFIIKPGFAWIKGRWVESDEDITLTEDFNVDPGYIRADIVVLRCNYMTREFSVELKKGTPTPSGSTPSIPPVLDDNGVKEIMLAGIMVQYAADPGWGDGVYLVDEREFAILKTKALDSDDYYTKTQIDTKLGGLNFVKCTQDEYDEMETHNPNTVYFIVPPEEE